MREDTFKRWWRSRGGASNQRAENLDRLRQTSYDLLVIGGGITGAGTALDASLRGLRVALIDKGDFASGTSSASSKLIHGGIRYLENGQFGLVREALRERHALLDNAPHLVRPLRILLPLYKSARRPRWLIKIGMSLYDWLAGRDRIGYHRSLNVQEIEQTAPGIRTNGLRGGFEFFDAQMDDARLCLEVVLTAMVSGADAANYVEAVEIHHDRTGRVCGCEARDRVTGETIGVRARQVVNAAGPWLDQIARIDDSAAPCRLDTTKGVHIVLPDMGLGAGLLLTHPDDGRVMFILPWMKRTLVGTTDTFFDHRPDDVTAGDGDVRYLLAAVNHFFSRTLTSTDVVATLAGLRPLVRGSEKNPSAVSREFALYQAQSGLWSMAGGKYTTYRSMAEAMVDRLVAEIGAATGRPHCRTATHRLIGCPLGDWSTFREQTIRELADRYHLDSPQAAHLVDRYGSRASAVGELSDESSRQPIVAGEDDLLAELDFQAAAEMAVCPADHLLRRTRLGLFFPEQFGDHLKYSMPIHSDTFKE